MTFNFDYPTKVTDLTFGQVNSVTDLTWKSLTFWPFSKNLHAVLICEVGFIQGQTRLEFWSEHTSHKYNDSVYSQVQIIVDSIPPNLF